MFIEFPITVELETVYYPVYTNYEELLLNSSPEWLTIETVTIEELTIYVEE